MKKIWKYFYTMKCAIALLLALAVISVIGTILPGGEWVFRSWVFVIPAMLLALNLLLCSVQRFPELLVRWRVGFRLAAGNWTRNAADTAAGPEGTQMCRVTGVGQAAEALFGALKIRVYERQEMGGATWTYGHKYRFGIWGSWFCHLGMLILVIGVVLGQFLVQSTYVYGVPGQAKQVAGTALVVAIEEFEEVRREDGSAEQYRSRITVIDSQTETQVSGELQVNKPMSAFGLDFLQSGSGWAVMLDIYRGGELLDSGLLCEGEAIEMADVPLQLVLEPDDAAQEKTGVTCLFYYEGEFTEERQTAIGEAVEMEGYQFVFRSPQKYTMIQAVSDPTGPVVFLGAVLVLLGAAVAFGFRPRELWVREDPFGLIVYCRCRRDGGQFAEQVKACCAAVGDK